MIIQKCGLVKLVNGLNQTIIEKIMGYALYSKSEFI
jgi:hypothetical protein